MEKRHRVFIAINLPQDVKRQLAKYQQEWADLPAKWTTAENLHITLEFLGDLTDVEIADVCKAVSEAVKGHKPFTVSLHSILYGPVGKIPPKMVWAIGEKSDELAELRQDLQEYLLEAVRFRPEGRGFVPHITLARIIEWQFRQIEPEERPEIKEDVDFVFTVESIEVMESVLKRTGPVYTILESHQLGE